MLTKESMARVGAWEGYVVSSLRRFEAGEQGPRPEVWIELRPRGNRLHTCGECGRKVRQVHDWHERWVRDLPMLDVDTRLLVNRCRVACRTCGPRVEALDWLLPGEDGKGWNTHTGVTTKMPLGRMGSWLFLNELVSRSSLLVDPLEEPDRSVTPRNNNSHFTPGWLSCLFTEIQPYFCVRKPLLCQLPFTLSADGLTLPNGIVKDPIGQSICGKSVVRPQHNLSTIRSCPGAYNLIQCWCIFAANHQRKD